MKRSFLGIGVLVVFIIVIIYIIRRIKRRMGWGVVNNNPFNIRKGENWLGEIEGPGVDTGGFSKFVERKYGVRAGLKNLWNGYFSKGYTLRKLITIYAPPSENDTERYIERVCKYAGIKESDIPGKDKYLKIAEAIVIVENGSLIVSHGVMIDVIHEFNLLNFV